MLMMSVTCLATEYRRARDDYEILETLEAGIMLTGSEVKSLRTGTAQINDAYASPERGELWLINAYIPEFLQANRFNHEEKRPRKLLVNKKELVRLAEGVERAGNTFVLLKLNINELGFLFFFFGLGKGKKSFDKRETE